MLQKSDRERLLEKLTKKYSQPGSFLSWIIYWRKKVTWWFVIGGIKLIKRTLDIFVSLFLLVVLSPLFILIAAIIKFYDGGPVFYVANRVGLWGKEFRFPKFRTMVIDADKKMGILKPQADFPGSIRFKMKEDPRVTSIGRFLRKSTLDELPQLWSVLKGDMSLVGPRPPLPEEVALYNLEQRCRLDAKPGLTCIWQVGGRSEIPFEMQVRMDKEYIESQSFWLDLKLLIKTIPAIFFGRGAS
jgi:lipopolysaccharide/colanic/teichoic acid biosynthesis glycosyltransferase